MERSSALALNAKHNITKLQILNFPNFSYGVIKAHLSCILVVVALHLCNEINISYDYQSEVN